MTDLIKGELKAYRSVLRWMGFASPYEVRKWIKEEVKQLKEGNNNGRKV